jgi:hypothetical protein
MSVTMEQVVNALEPDEPNYAKAASLGPDAIPHLEALVNTESRLSTKAVYLAGLIQDERSVGVLVAAALSKLPEVRVAAAFAGRNLRSPGVESVIRKLESDTDEGIRIQATRSRVMRTGG